MPPSRFATSPWRNFLATSVPDELRKQSGIGDSALLQASGRALYGLDSAGTTLTRVALGGGGGGVGSDASFSHKVGASGGAGQITALALSPFEVDGAGNDLVAVGTQQGAVKVVLAGEDGGSIVAEWKSDPALGTASISAVDFHPHASDLLLVGHAKGASLARIQANEAHTALSIALVDKVSLYAASWSVDGITIGTTSSDQRLSLWDPRASVSQPSASADSIHGAKLRPTKLAFTQNHILTSGFDLGRQREWAVWDPRALSRPVHRASIPSSSTAVLAPIVDVDRSLIYLHGKGDTSMHVVDLSLAPYTAKATPLPYPASAIALAPLLRPSESAMKGEIGRIFLTTPANDAVIPVSVTIPRRQYLDFHEDLYPHTFAPFPAHTADSWLEGNNLERVRISQDPTRRQSQLDSARQKAGSSVPKVSSVPAAPVPKIEAEQPTAARAVAPESAVFVTAPSELSKQSPNKAEPFSSGTSTASSLPAASAPSPQLSESKPTTPPAVRQSNNQPIPNSEAKVTSTNSPVSSTPVQPSVGSRPSHSSGNAGRPVGVAATSVPPQPAADWSRRFLAGSTPLIPEFNNVGGIASTISAESRLLGLTVIASPSGTNPKPGYLVFPLAGPGGRIGVHPLSQPGRFPLLADLPALDGGSGTAVVDFVCSPFLTAVSPTTGGGEVYVLNADSKVRKWALPLPPPPLPADCLPLGPGAKRQPTKDELEQSAVHVPQRPELVLDATAAAKGGRVIQVEPHPHVKGLVAALVAGPPARVLVWREDAAREAEEIEPELSVDVGGATSGALGFAWSPSGSLIAVAGKDKKLRVGDVRAIKAGQTTWAEVAAHDSPRAFKLIWLSERHIATTGHGLGSIRQLKLYEVERSSASSERTLTLKDIETLSLDSSPAVLWPWFDPDTGILLLYARGERAVNAFEVRLPGATPSTAAPAASGPRKYGSAAAASGGNKSAFFALPAFGHANPQQALAFLTKRQLDVVNVEVAAAYLLSAKGEIQRVPWSITRARPDFFQDDIFVETEVVEEPSSADPAAWLDAPTSHEAEQMSRRKVSLCPEGMQPLSLAPAVQHTSKLAKGPTAKELTDKEKEEVFLQAAFKKVKDEDVRGADVGTEAAKRTPANDDWSDDD
ncbi:unnamed protein product [Tilletia laevis]|uniref:Coronin-7 n=2 Tax=Tilletia TaxID=13289 RepID=A0A177VHQ1_9BASI|nr:hypothetical protein CF336_g635 [Tilletia laevis]KAE8265117.1 hypothetical protein A4X03_0g473 [Tilletia caries]CAD6974077.1 unnamed protein product [Tilletia controversa]KAE8208307.1 hypothetical protein CF335_g512 [Tilletia laevis]CAD6886095.1 unnamed protein product [Tilletia caries]